MYIGFGFGNESTAITTIKISNQWMNQSNKNSVPNKKTISENLKRYKIFAKLITSAAITFTATAAPVT